MKLPLLLSLFLPFVINLTHVHGSTFEVFFDTLLPVLLKDEETIIDPLPIDSQHTTVGSELLGGVISKVPGSSMIPGKGTLGGLLNVDIDLEDIKIHGIKTLHRFGDVSQTMEEGRTTSRYRYRKTVMHLAIDDMLTTANLRLATRGLNNLRLLRRKFETNVSMFSNTTTFRLILESDSATGGIFVTQFQLLNMENLQVKLDLQGYLGKATNLLVAQIVKRLKGVIVSSTEEVIREQIERKLNNLPDGILKNVLFG